MNKRITKKLSSRCGYKTYREYKQKVLKPWKEYMRNLNAKSNDEDDFLED